MILKIYKLGEDVLREKCAPVAPEEINDEMRSLFEDMFETMVDANGVGLAAPQVGIAKRFFVVISDDDVKRVFINPQIVATSKELVPYDEGCLSLPGFDEEIVRPARVTIQALNEFGKPFTLETDGLLARIVQHENDHLDGIVYIDRGDKEFAEKVTEKMRNRLEKARKKEEEKAKKAASIAAKKAAKEASKAKK